MPFISRGRIEGDASGFPVDLYAEPHSIPNSWGQVLCFSSKEISPLQLGEEGFIIISAWWLKHKKLFFWVTEPVSDRAGIWTCVGLALEMAEMCSNRGWQHRLWNHDNLGFWLSVWLCTSHKGACNWVCSSVRWNNTVSLLVQVVSYCMLHHCLMSPLEK